MKRIVTEHQSWQDKHQCSNNTSLMQRIEWIIQRRGLRPLLHTPFQALDRVEFNQTDNQIETLRPGTRDVLVNVCAGFMMNGSYLIMLTSIALTTTKKHLQTFIYARLSFTRSTLFATIVGTTPATLLSV